MTREEAEKLVDELLDLCVDYERATSYQVKYIPFPPPEFLLAKENVIVALIGAAKERRREDVYDPDGDTPSELQEEAELLENNLDQGRNVK